MTDRTLELILKVNNQSTQAIQQLKGEIQDLLKDVQGLIDQIEKARAGGGSIPGSGGTGTPSGGTPKPPGTSKDETEALVRFAQQLKITYAEAEQLTKGLGLTADQSRIAVEQLRKFESVKLNPEVQFQALNTQLGISRDQFGGLQKAAIGALGQESTGAGGLFSALTTGAGGAVGAVAGISFAFNQITAAVQGAFAAAKPFYDATIGAAETFKTQVISSQAQIASNSRLFGETGKEITDVTQKIDALEGLVKRTLERVRVDVRELSGLTGQDTDLITSSTINQFSALQGQFDKLKQSNKDLDSTDKIIARVVKGFGALATVNQVPIFQIPQEVRALLTGEGGPDAILARKLFGSDAELRKYKDQGNLLVEFIKRSEAAIAANLKQTDTISGQASNIASIFQDLGLKFGTALNEGLAKVFKGVYDQLAKIEAPVTAFAENVSQGIVKAFTGLAEKIAPTIAPVGKAMEGLFASIGNFAGKLSEGFGGSFAQILGTLAQVLTGTLSTALTVTANSAKLLFDVLSAIVSNQVVRTGFAAIADAVSLLGDAVNGALGIFSQFNTAATEAFGGAFAEIQKYLDQVTQAFAPVGDSLKDLFGTIGAIVGPVLQAIAKDLVPIGKAILDAFFPINQFVVPGIKLLGQAIGTLKDAVVGTFQDIGQGISGIVKNITGVLKGIVDNPAFVALAKASGISVDQIKKGLADLEKQQSQTGEAIKTTAKEAQAAQKDLNIKPNIAPDIGTQFDQIKQKLQSTRKTFEEAPQGAEFANAVKERVALLQQAAEKGIISPEEAQRELEAIRGNVKVEKDLQESAAQAITKVRKQALDNQTADVKGQQAQIEQAIKRGNISQEEGAKQLSNAKRKQLQNQLSDVQAQIKLEGDAIAKGSGSKSRLAQLQAQEKEVRSQIVGEEIAGREKVQQARERESALQKADLDAQLRETQAAIASGTISQVEGAKRVTAIKKEQLALQLADVQKAIQDEQAAIGAGQGSPQRLKELQAKQKTLLADQKTQEVEGQKQIQEAALQQVQKAQDKATSVVKLAETERLQEVQKLVNAGVLNKQEAEEAKLQASRKTIEEELRVAKEGLAQLEALPKSSDPKIEEDRQQKIRGFRQKTADLTLRLLENEKAQQEAALEAFKRKQDDIALAIKNAQEQQKIGFQAQLQLLESANKLLERRSQLLEAQKNLIKSASDLQQSGFKNAIDLLQSQFDTEDKILDRQKQREDLKKRLAEGDTGAAEELAALDRREARERQIINLKIEAKQAELVALDKQQALEAQSFVLEEQKTKLLQKQEEIRLRIALADAKSAQAQAVADAAKTAADPNATGAQKEAAQIAVQAATQKTQFAQEAIVLQKEISATTGGEFAAKRQTLANQQSQQRQDKQTELQTLQNQQFGLSPLQQGTPEDIANQRAVAAEDAQRRAGVQAEEARMRGYSTPLQQAQQSRLANDALGQYLRWTQSVGQF